MSRLTSEISGREENSQAPPPRCKLLIFQLERLAVMKDRLNSLRDTLERSFGFSGEPKRVLGGLSHEVYVLKAENVIIKVYSNEISIERLQAEVDILEKLSGSDLIRTPILIPSLQGDFRVPFGLTHLSCFKRLEGERRFFLTQCPEDLSLVQHIGNYLGLLHREVSAYSKERDSRFSPILEMAKSLSSLNATKVEVALDKLFQSEAPYFLTHGDFQASNLLYIGDSISAIIDFEYSSLDYRINDVAGCLSNLLSANEDNLDSNELVQRFILGYEGSFKDKLSEIELELLPTLLRLIWQVNLAWTESRLKQTHSSENRELLELYFNQTTLQLNSERDLI